MVDAGVGDSGGFALQIGKTKVVLMTLVAPKRLSKVPS